MTLYEDVLARTSDPEIVAVVMEEVLEPTKGPNSVICPPTYSGGEQRKPHFAVSEGPVPRPDATGWYREAERAPESGEVRMASRVVVNALAACADRAETAIYRYQHELGLTLPAFVVCGHPTEAAIDAAISRSKQKAKVTADLREQIRRALDIDVSTWELAHRTADSWLQFAVDPVSGRQIWATTDGAIKKVLLAIGHEAGENVYAHAPNAAVYGAWLSSGTARRQAIPRAYSCEITGYGAKESVRAATKLDRMGGAPKSVTLSSGRDGIAQAAKGDPPAKLGFGQIPSDPAPRGFTCEVILSQASISLRALDRFRYAAPDDSETRDASEIPDGAATDREHLATQRRQAATRVYTLLAMAGHLLAQRDGFLRSECDLVTVEQRWGWRRHGVRQPIPLPIPNLPEVADALQQAVADAAEVGLVFAKPCEVSLSEPQIDLVVERVVAEALKVTVDD